MSLLLSVTFMHGIAWRAVHEEQPLSAELQGYREYAARVSYRLVPYVW